MKAAFKTFLCLAVVFAVVGIVRAEDEKKAEVKTLKGEIGCPKCVFKVKGFTDKCRNAIKVKDGDKETIYIFDDKGGAEKYHKKICSDSAKGSVKGTLSKKDKQDFVKPEKDSVKFDED